MSDKIKKKIESDADKTSKKYESITSNDPKQTSQTKESLVKEERISPQSLYDAYEGDLDDGKQAPHNGKTSDTLSSKPILDDHHKNFQFTPKPVIPEDNSEKDVFLYPTAVPNQKKILVFCRGEFGGIVKACGAFKALRQNFPNDFLVCCTYPEYEKFINKIGFFDEIITDERNRGLWSSIQFSRSLKARAFEYIFDLEGSDQVNTYFTIINWLGGINQSDIDKGAKWIGFTKKSRYALSKNTLKTKHPYERFYNLLRKADLNLGQRVALLPDFSNVQFKTRFEMPKPYFMMIPGSGSHRHNKRWPALFYAEIANKLREKGVKSVLIGSKHERTVADVIMKKCPSCIDLIGKTDYHEILPIAQNAVGVIGNDTGPLFLADAAGIPLFVPWSAYSDEMTQAPQGDNVTLFREPFLTNLSPHRVWHEIERVLPHNKFY